MPFTETGNEGLLNGTTPVTLTPAPASGARHNVFAASIHNADSAPATVTLRKNKGGVLRRVGKETLQPGETWEYTKALILDATDESFEAVLDAAHTSVAPEFDTAYAVITP